MTETPDEPQAPRLQDTTERAALPLPLPGGAPADEPAPVEDAAPAPEEPEPAAEVPPDVPAPDPAPLPDPDPIREPPPDPLPEPPPPAAEGNGAGGHDAGLPPFEPAPSVAGIAVEDEGLPAEVLIGAAFLGGLALAFLIKRLGS